MGFFFIWRIKIFSEGKRWNVLFIKILGFEGTHTRKYIWKAENTFHVELKTFERQKMVLKISNIVSRIGSRRLNSLKVTLILQNLQKLSSITFDSEAHVLHLSDTETSIPSSILFPHWDVHSETLANLPLQNPMHPSFSATQSKAPKNLRHPTNPMT